MQAISNFSELRNSIDSLYKAFSPQKRGSISHTFEVRDPLSNEEPNAIKITVTRQHRWNKSAIGIAFSKLFHAKKTEVKIEEITGDTKTKIVEQNERLNKLLSKQKIEKMMLQNANEAKMETAQAQLATHGGAQFVSSHLSASEKEVNEPIADSPLAWVTANNIPKSNLEKPVTFTYNKGKWVKKEKIKNELCEKLFGVKTSISDRTSTKSSPPLAQSAQMPSQADMKQAIAKRQKKSEQTSEVPSPSVSANSEVQSTKHTEQDSISRPSIGIPEKLQAMHEEANRINEYAKEKSAAIISNCGANIQKIVKNNANTRYATGQLVATPQEDSLLVQSMQQASPWGNLSSAFGQIKDIIKGANENGVAVSQANSNYTRLGDFIKHFDKNVDILRKQKPEISSGDEKFLTDARTKLINMVGTLIDMAVVAKKSAQTQKESETYDTVLKAIKENIEKARNDLKRENKDVSTFDELMAKFGGDVTEVK